MSPFYFAELNKISDEEIILSSSESKHLTRVMRAKRGEIVIITDGLGITYQCSLAATKGGESHLKIISRSRNVGEPARRVTLGLGLSPSTKFDLALQMGVEVGVCGFAPLICEKSKMKMESAERMKTKMRRWREIIKASITQCERSRLPEISRPIKFKEYLKAISSDCAKIIAVPSAVPLDSPPGFEAIANASQPIVLLVGPESGFSPTEVELAVASGFARLKLPGRTLRTQTAAVVLSALAVYSAGERA